MSGTVADRKRLLHVTAGNLRNSHIYIRAHLDFFPPECIGGPRKNRNRNDGAAGIRIFLEGLNRAVETDIGCDARTGEPRRFFRGRTWVREFFDHHKIRTGDVPRKYATVDALFLLRQTRPYLCSHRGPRPYARTA